MAAATVAVVTSGVIVACKKSGTEPVNSQRKSANVAEACSCSAVATTDSTISGQITSDLYLSNTKVYKLSGLVFVTGNHTLTIQEGTRVLGLAGSADGTQPGGGLVITRGSKLNAIGTSSCPIVFTSYRYDSAPQRGDWAGVVLLGNAPTNNYPASIEGINSTTYPGIDLVYGSATPNAADNSGTLKFVRIEYAGFVLSADNEMNGLTLAGVGSGTTIEYVEVFKSNDDSFEFFGGTVNPKHIISVDGLDDMFDTDNGYSGTISYALGLSDTSRADISQSNGFESDNNSTGSTASPNTHAHYDYITIIGVANAARAASQTTIPPSGNTNGGTARYGRAAHLRRGAEFEINHGIFMGFNYGISMDSALGSTNSKYYAGTSWIKNTYVQAYSTSATPAVGPFATESNGVSATGVNFSNSVLFYNTATTLSADNNFGVISSVANALGLVDPFNRNSAGASNFFADEFSDAYGANAGAFPGNVDWTIVDGCSSWTRYQ
jgi:hypothetical protein